MGRTILQKRCLSSVDIAVSVVGLGTVKFGRNTGVKYPQTFHLPSDEEIRTLLATAQSLGINLLDTAPAYGDSEERLGKLLRGFRQEWIISTKAGEEFVNGDSFFDFSPAAIRSSVERSLQRLQTDYLDIVFVHSDGNDERIIKEQNVFSVLADLKTAGKIRAYGMSTKTIAGGLLTIDYADAAMVSFNPEYQAEKEIITYAEKKKKSIFIKKAFASGHLSSSFPLALQYILKERGVTSVVIGTIHPKHLRDNVQFLSKK